MRPSLCEPLLAETDQHHEGEGVEGSGEANTKRRGSVEAEETEINLKTADDAVICQVKISSPLSSPPKTNVHFKPLQRPSSPSQRTPESVESSESPTSKEKNAGE